MVIKTINGIYDLNDTQREGNCCVIVSSSILCDACRRFVFPPVVRAPMNLNLDCPAGCTHTHTHKKKNHTVHKITVTANLIYCACGLFFLPFFYPFVIFHHITDLRVLLSD